MKISITTDDGEVVDIIKAEDIGDLSKPMAQTDLMIRIMQSQVKALEMETPTTDNRSTKEYDSLEDMVKDYGFSGTDEFHRLMASADLSTPAKRATFNAWRENDGSKAGLLKLQKPVAKPQREIRINKNERGRFECWEPNGCGPGKHALFSTMPSMEEAILKVTETHKDCGLELVSRSSTEARFKLNL